MILFEPIDVPKTVDGRSIEERRMDVVRTVLSAAVIEASRQRATSLSEYEATHEWGRDLPFFLVLIPINSVDRVRDSEMLHFITQQFIDHGRAIVADAEWRRWMGKAFCIVRNPRLVNGLADNTPPFFSWTVYGVPLMMSVR